MKIYSCLCVVAICFCSCGDGIDRGSKPVFPVTGKVIVDGSPPGSVVQIGVHYEGGMDAEDPSTSSGLTQPDGTFALNTYTTGDGLPAGKYKLTFTWKEFNAMSMGYTGEDKLHQRYSDVKTAPVEFTVDGSGPIDLGTIRLTTE